MLDLSSISSISRHLDFSSICNCNLNFKLLGLPVTGPVHHVLFLTRSQQSSAFNRSTPLNGTASQHRFGSDPGKNVLCVFGTRHFVRTPITQPCATLFCLELIQTSYILCFILCQWICLRGGGERDSRVVRFPRRMANFAKCRHALGETMARGASREIFMRRATASASCRFRDKNSRLGSLCLVHVRPSPSGANIQSGTGVRPFSGQLERCTVVRASEALGAGAAMTVLSVQAPFASGDGFSGDDAAFYRELDNVLDRGSFHEAAKLASSFIRADGVLQDRTVRRIMQGESSFSHVACNNGFLRYVGDDLVVWTLRICRHQVVDVPYEPSHCGRVCSPSRFCAQGWYRAGNIMNPRDFSNFIGVRVTPLATRPFTSRR